MGILFQLQNLNLSFGEKVIFKNTSLSVEKGEKIGLIGLNGQGKSTLFKIIQQLIKPDISTPPFSMETNNTDFRPLYIPQEFILKEKINAKNYYLVFYPELQKIKSQLLEIEEELATNYSDQLIEKQQKLLEQFEREQGWQIEQKYLNYLKLFNFHKLDADVSLLSGGEQRKMALALGLSTTANLVLWDEPTNHLDTSSIELFEEEIQKSDKTMIIISHDRYLLNEATSRIIHIENGSITSFSGQYLEYLDYKEQKQQELEKNLEKLSNKKRRELAWMRQGVKARRTRSKKRVESYHALEQEIQQLKSHAKNKVQLNLEHSGKKSKILWEITDGKFQYDIPLLENINLTIHKGDKIGLLGPNGAGKSSLIKIIQGSLNLKTGKINQPREIKTVIFDQKRESLPENLSLFELIGDGQEQVHLPSGKTQHVASYLQKFLFQKEQLHRPIHTLSGGEKNRLQLAQFLKQSADLWIFDEPTNDLDIETIELLEETLINYSEAIIIISHDRAFIDRVCKKSWLISDQNVEVFDGGYSQVADYLSKKETLKSLSQKESSPSSRDKPNKMTYQEKMRWEVIEEELQKAEEKVVHYEQIMANFDFTKENYTEEFSKLEIKLSDSKKLVDKLFEEWEKLSQKEP